MEAEENTGKRSTRAAEQPPHAKGKALDRRHWAARIGVSFGALKNEGFKAQFPFNSRLHDIKGKNYHYVDEGNGEPVVMVHGNPTWSFFYRRLINGLRSEYRCLAADHMGCGLSEKPKKYRYTLQQHILNLETWLEGILPPLGWNGSRINLVVHDWGGPIGIGYALRHPERINRIVVLNTSVFTAGTMPLRIKVCRVPYLGAFLVRGLNLFASLAPEMTTVKKIAYRAKKAYTMPYNSWRNRIGVYNFIKDIPLEPDTPTRKLFYQMENMLEEKLGDKPVLIQWGMKDWCFTPFFLNLWKKQFPEAEVDEYNAGHFVLEDAGDQIVKRMKEFLAKPVPEGSSL